MRRVGTGDGCAVTGGRFGEGRTPGEGDPLEVDDRIQDLARGFELKLDAPAVAALARFAALFLKWNAHINLGAFAELGEFLDRHLVDALAASKFVEVGSRVVDIGSGGGLPVLPLAILCGHARFDLYEPIAKKVAFIRTAIRELGLAERVRVERRRIAEPLPEGLAGAYDVSMSRATFSPAAWLALGRALVKPTGQVLVFGTPTGEAVHLVGPSAFLDYRPERRLLVFHR